VNNPGHYGRSKRRKDMRPLTATESGVEKTYHFRAWVHPKSGGDDKEYDIEIIAEDEHEANQEIVKWLKKRSDVTEDYKLMKVTEKKLQPKLSKASQDYLRSMKIWLLQHTNITMHEINAKTPERILALYKELKAK